MSPPHQQRGLGMGLCPSPEIFQIFLREHEVYWCILAQNMIYKNSYSKYRRIYDTFQKYRIYRTDGMTATTC